MLGILNILLICHFTDATQILNFTVTSAILFSPLCDAAVGPHEKIWTNNENRAKKGSQLRC